MEFSKREIITTAWMNTKNNLSILIFISTIYLLIIMTLLQIFTLMSPDLSNHSISENIPSIFNMPSISAQGLLFVVASVLFITGINLGFLQICIKIFKNDNINIRQLFSQFNVLLPYIMTTIYYGLAHILIAAPGIIILLLFIKLNVAAFFYYLGIFLIMFPTIYLSLRLQFYVYFLIDKETGCIESLRRSFIISKGYVYPLFVISIILSIIIQISIIPFFLGLIIALPYSKMVTTYIYIKLSKVIKF